ncbi:MAG TPA: FtsX-like permease family protein [Polyangiaceae bacterium]|jgi:putative ABC transport system permease protein|nr:FtsX-like permease family protein [Polyangiaceae bacterium]
MTLGGIAARNVLRNKVRTVLTVFGVAIAILVFVLLQTVLDAWMVAADSAAKDRIGTRHKVTFVMPLPKRYVDDIRNTPGVKSATWLNWFGGKDPRNEKEFFGTVAVDPASFLEVYDEIELPQDQAERWREDRQGAVVGDVLAKKLGWKVGDRVTLSGTIFPGDWEFRIVGIYTAKRKSVDRSSFWFRWDYLNDAVPPRMQDQVGWIAARIDDPGRSAQISQEIDRKFEERDIQTLTMSERALSMSAMGMFSAVLKAMNVISIVILLIMTLILGNTIAMGVRERTHEYGTLRAIGFLPRHLAIFVMAEALTIGALGGAVGLGLAYPFINNGIGRFLEENMGGIFPYFRIEPKTAVLAFGLALVFAGAASALPAYRVARLQVTDALRRVG